MSGPPSPRPRWHFAARSGWVNDPLAVTWHNGAYHLFFQYLPGRSEWAPQCEWGHASSPDLCHWTELPVALTPTADETGCWSGDIATGSGPAALFYTSVGPGDVALGRVRRAEPQAEDWLAWSPGPVVAVVPDSLGAIAFRDPTIVRQRDRWRMLVGAALPGDVAAVIGFSSTDMTAWDYDGVLARRSAHDRHGSPTGTMWECPQLIDVDGRAAFVVAVWDRNTLTHVAAAPAAWDGDRLELGEWQTLSYGSSYYAATAFVDAGGDTALMYWLREAGDSTAGWTGAHSVPHTLRWHGDRLVARPHANVLAAAGESHWQHFTPGRGATATSFGSVEVRGGRLSLTTAAGPTLDMPYLGGPVGVLTDGTIVEIFTEAGVISAAIRVSAAGSR